MVPNMDWATRSIAKGLPRAPIAHGLRVGLVLSQIVSLARLLVLLILSLIANADLVVSQIRIGTC